MIRVTVTADCVKRLQKHGPEVIHLSSGEELLIEWSNSKGVPLAVQNGLPHRGDGCFVQEEP